MASLRDQTNEGTLKVTPPSLVLRRGRPSRAGRRDTTARGAREQHGARDTNFSIKPKQRSLIAGSSRRSFAPIHHTSKGAASGVGWRSNRLSRGEFSRGCHLMNEQRATTRSLKYRTMIERLWASETSIRNKIYASSVPPLFLTCRPNPTALLTGDDGSRKSTRSRAYGQGSEPVFSRVY